MVHATHSLFSVLRRSLRHPTNMGGNRLTSVVVAALVLRRRRQRYGLASAASGNSTATTRRRRNGGAVSAAGTQHPWEASEVTTLSGDTLAKVTAAALARSPVAIIVKLGET